MFDINTYLKWGEWITNLQVYSIYDSPNRYLSCCSTLLLLPTPSPILTNKSLSLPPSFYNSLSHHHELRSRRYSLYYSSWCLHKRVDLLYTCTSYYILQIKGYIEPHIYISVQVNNQEKGSSGGAKRDSEANRRQCQKEEREEEKEADQGDGIMEKDGLSCQKTLFKCCFSSQGSQKWSVYYPAFSFSFILHVYIYLQDEKIFIIG